MEAIFLLIIALLVGAGFPIQSGINAMIATYLGHPLAGALANTAVASIVLFVAMIVLHVPMPSAGHIAGTPFWAWTGGVLGAFFVLSSLVVAPKMGAAAFLTATIAGTMVMALIVDQYGFLAFKPDPVTVQRVAGVLLVVAGTVLLQWKR